MSTATGYATGQYRKEIVVMGGQSYPSAGMGDSQQAHEFLFHPLTLRLYEPG